MSSNLRLLRVCQHCHTEFIAQKTVTKYCGLVCAQRAYKNRMRRTNIDRSNKETLQAKSRKTLPLSEREFLSVTQVSELLGCSRANVYKLIKSGKLRATNLLIKKTIVRKCDILAMFEKRAENKHNTPLSMSYYELLNELINN